MNPKMHDNNVFSTPRRNSTKIITNSQHRLHKTTTINFCEPEQKIGFACLFEQTNSCVGTPRSMWR